jgi:hypothetical protein
MIKASSDKISNYLADPTRESETPNSLFLSLFPREIDRVNLQPVSVVGGRRQDKERKKQLYYNRQTKHT